MTITIRPPQFKFCPMCGTALAEKQEEGRPRSFCPGCGWVYYPHSASAVVGVIWNMAKGEVLLVQRGREPHKGQWSLPAGFMEFGEHPEDTLRREIQEETGMEVTGSEFLDIKQGLDDPRAPGQLVFFYRVGAMGEPTLNDPEENLDIRWWPIDALPQIAWGTHREVLASLK